MIQYFPTVTGSLVVSGSLLVSGGITASGGISISGSIASASFASTASFIENAQSASYVLTAQTASFVANAQTASYVLNAVSSSFASTASFVALAQSASNAVVAQTSSYANSLTVAGTLTAQTLVVQTITSSVDFVTGSTRFGSILGNTHVFSGSVTMNPGGLFVSSSGNVGIGTISSTVNLLQKYLSITDNYNVGIILNDTRDASAFEIYNAGGDFYINYGTTNRLRIIGSTGTATFSNTETTFNFNPQSGSLLSGYNYLNFGGGSIMYRNTTDLYIGSNAKYGSAGTLVANYTSANGMGLLTMDGGTLNWQAATGSVTANTTYGVPIRFTITSEGNVGIANASPQGKLHIGSALSNAADASNGLILKQTGTNETTGIYLERSGERKGYAIYVGGSVDSLVFQRNNEGTKSDVMTLTRDGNVGFGTATPQRQFVIANSSGDGLEISNSSGYSTLLPYNRTTSAYQNLVLGEGTSKVLIGTTSDNGQKLQVNGSLYAASVISSGTSIAASTYVSAPFGFYTTSANNAIPFTTWTTLTTVEGNTMAMYLVVIGLAAGGLSDWSATGILYSNGTTASWIVGPTNGSLVQLRISGTSIQVYQNGGSPSQTLYYKLLKIA
jgi:hypothetical protein